MEIFHSQAEIIHFLAKTTGKFFMKVDFPRIECWATGEELYKAVPFFESNLSYDNLHHKNAIVMFNDKLEALEAFDQIDHSKVFVYLCGPNGKIKGKYFG